MDASEEALLDRLLEAGIVAVSDEEDEVRLSPAVRDEIEGLSETLLDRELGDVAEEFESAFDRRVLNAGRELAETDLPYVAEWRVFSDRLPDSSPEEVLRLLTVLDLFQGESTETAGVPEPFLPVSGERLRTLLKLYDRAIVYVWKHDCPPCDTVRSDLEELLEEPPSGIPLFAVYGPDAATLLYDAYTVVGAPTVLFVLNDEVDLRLEGPQERDVLQREIEKFPTVLAGG